MAKLVACQLVSTPDIEANLKKVDALLAGLHSEGPVIAVLPECFACFGGGDKRLLEIAEPLGNGYIQSKIQAMAAEHGVWIVAGTIPTLSNNKEKFYASCLVYDDKGARVADYQKIHLFDVQVQDNTGVYSESLYTMPGNKVVCIDNTPFGRIGVAVCYDLRFPGLFQAMGEVDVLVLPSAFTYKTGQAHWLPLLQARAIEKQCYVIAANQGGEHPNGRQTWGHSCIISPWGERLAETGSGAGVAFDVMDRALLKRVRANMPVLQHNRFRSDFDTAG